MFVSLQNLGLSISTVILQITTFFIVFSYFTNNSEVINIIKKKAILLSFIFVSIATLGSMVYSEFAGFVPCNLCWYQRLFMYPQVIILGIGLWKKENIVTAYNALILSVIGAIIALYQYLLQFGIINTGPCPATGVSSCSQVNVLSFGYITIPMMSLTVFVLIAVMMFIKLKNKK